MITLPLGVFGMSKGLFLLVVVVCAFASIGQHPAGMPNVTQGSLYAQDKEGKILGPCPLENTSVRTEISGFLARVRVRQEFENSFAEAIEAVYTFPLSQKGAVDDMTMTVGTRTIRGKIMKRDDARAAYEQARTEGKTASLLDQERPNIFTQSVANIMPGEKVVVEISYVETLKYEDGAYEFVFPMTVGPRYNPASVSDASKVSPPVAVDRPGHDIAIEVNLDSGVPVEAIRSASHDIQQINVTPSKAQVTLKSEKTIPNKDFVLRYDVTGGRIQDAILAHRGERGGFFTMILQPPDEVASEDRTPKEIVFVLDTSGSMEGFPIEKAKEAMKLSLDGLYPEDTFNLITFAGDTHVLFEKPVPATHANLMQALGFLETRRGSGGTEMMKAIKAALAPSGTSAHLRIVCFMTDGYVSNEAEIIAEIQKRPSARVFSFGIGDSVNRYLLDKMAEAGKGEVEYVSLAEDGSKAAMRFYKRVRTPLLTDLSIEWNGLPVADVYPDRLGDLFSAKPVIMHGRYTKAAGGKALLRGKLAGQEYRREIVVDLPEREIANDSLASLWAHPHRRAFERKATR
jgi:Ca-activated chloride channel family protein